MTLVDGDRYSLIVDGKNYIVGVVSVNWVRNPHYRSWYLVSKAGVRIPGWDVKEDFNASIMVLGRTEDVDIVNKKIKELGMKKILIIKRAPHIGSIKLNLTKEFPSGNALEYDDFVNGEELVRLNKNNAFVYKINSLQAWFNTGDSKNPLSGRNITQDDIERFTYVEDLTLGGRRRRRYMKTLKRRTTRRKNSRSKINLRKRS
jgi:hypothetical protein